MGMYVQAHREALIYLLSFTPMEYTELTSFSAAATLLQATVIVFSSLYGTVYFPLH